MEYFVKYVIATVLLLASLSSHAEKRSLEFCDALSDIEGKTIKAKRAGHSLTEILSAASSVLADSPERLQYVTSTVTAVYGDSSLRTYDQGYNAVFQSCM